MPAENLTAQERVRAILEADEDRNQRRIRHGLKDFNEVPPSRQRWNRLLEGLAHADAVLMDEPERWGFRANQWAAILSLWEVIDYLRQDVTISRLKLDRPLWECMAALVDANNGLSPSLFTPAAKAKPGKSMARNNIESISCLAMQELLEASFKRDEAARRVAEVLAKKQPSIKPRHNATLKSTVAGWRERAMQVRGGKEFEEKLAYWRHYHSKISSGTSTARQRADDLLSILKRPSTLTF